MNEPHETKPGERVQLDPERIASRKRLAKISVANRFRLMAGMSLLPEPSTQNQPTPQDQTGKQ